MQLYYELALVSALNNMPGSPSPSYPEWKISPLAGLAMMRSRRFESLASSTPSLLAQTVVEQ
jgi:hypothetical protein